MYQTLIKEKTDALKGLSVEINGIRAKYDGKPGDMTALEEERFDKILNDYSALETEIKTLNERNAKVSNVEAFEDTAVNALDIHGKGKKLDTAEKDALKTFGEALRLGSMGGGQFDSQAFRAELNNFAVNNPSKGGFSVVTQVLAQRLVELVADETFVRRQATVELLDNADSLGVVTFGDIDDFSWVAENADQAASSESPFGKRELQPKRIAKTIVVSKKLMNQSAMAESAIMSRAAYVYGRTEEKAFLLGTGVGQPLGIAVESADGVPTSRTSASGTANVISADDVWTVVGLLKAQYRRNARWIMHRNTEMRIRKLKAGSNEYLWQPIGTQNVNGLTVGTGPTLAGFPYDVTEFLTDPGATGNITTGTMALVLADLRAGYMIAQARALEITPLVEAYATKDQQGFAFNAYVDGMPVDENAFSRLKIA